MAFVYRTIKSLGLPRFESMYVAYCPERPNSAKVGIGQGADARMSSIMVSIKKELGVDVVVKRACPAAPVLFPKTMENIIHKILDRSKLYPRDPWLKGASGWTEWYKYRNWFTTAFLLLISCIPEFNAAPFWLLAGIALLTSRPIDFIILVWTLALAQYALLFCGLCVCWVGTYNIYMI